MREAYPICACCGTYDGTPHEGHKHFLREAKKHGELTVFIVPDRVVLQNKKRYPIYSQEERVRNVENLGIADHVVPLLGTDSDHLQQIFALQPNYYFLTPDQHTRFDRVLLRRLRRVRTVIQKVPRYMPHIYSTTRLHFS